MKAIAHSIAMLGNSRFGDQWRDRLKARWWPAQKAPKLGMRLSSAIPFRRWFACRPFGGAV
jgi:hypothetical protein